MSAAIDRNDEAAAKYFRDSMAELDRRARELSQLREENEKMRAAIAWACGEQPDPDGKWFGELQPETKPESRPRPFWWRSQLRRIAGY